MHSYPIPPDVLFALAKPSDQANRAAQLCDATKPVATLNCWLAPSFGHAMTAAKTKILMKKMQKYFCDVSSKRQEMVSIGPSESFIRTKGAS